MHEITGNMNHDPIAKISELLMSGRATLVKELECVKISFVAGTSLPTHKDQSLNTLQTMMFSNAYSSSANLACNIASFNGLQNEPQST
jgi:hypothetical protein